MSWIQDLFQREEIRRIPLEVDLDVREDGKWVTTLGYTLNNQFHPIDNLDDIGSYGFKITHGDAHYLLSQDDLQVLHSIKSLNPVSGVPGTFITEIRPQILKYLRNKPQVQESEESKEFEIRDEPLLPTARIDFEPDEGYIVETGFSLTDEGPVLSKDEIPITPDGEYFQLEKAFVPVPKDTSGVLGEWLSIGRKRVKLNEVPEFFQRDLVLLKSNFNAVLTDRAVQVHLIKETLEPRVRVRNDEPGWLDFEIDYVAGEYVIPADLIRSAKEKYVQSDPYTFIETDASLARKLDNAISELNPIETTGGYRIPIERFASLDDFIDRIGGEAELSAEYQAFLEKLTGFEANENFPLPDKVEKRLSEEQFQLRPYQRAGVHWLEWLKENHLHGILADDMGLGKTLQTILCIRMTYDSKEHTQHSLIICPKSVVHHWSREFYRVAPHLQIYEYLGTNRRRDLLRSGKPIIFISTYATVRNDIEMLRATPFLFIVLDEATRIKNPDAQRTQAIKRLNSGHRITLSGTPVENRPQELWSQFDFLMAGHLGRYGTFERVFANPITRGEQDISEKLGRRIRPFVLRRTKEEVAKDLPEKIGMDEWCELTEEQKSLYGQILDTFSPAQRNDLEAGRKVDTFSILPILTKLKQVCDHPSLITGVAEPVMGRSEKFDLAVNRIAEIKEAGEQVILFSQYLGMLDLLEIALVQIGISYFRVDGSTQNRQSIIDRFNQKNATVLLCSLLAMSHGVNLQTANHVIHVDRWWNPAIEDQATDRVHRIGQEKQVYVYRLIVQGTLEERIDRLQERKRDMAEDIVGAATRGTPSWTRDELLEILKPLER